MRPLSRSLLAASGYRGAEAILSARPRPCRTRGTQGGDDVRQAHIVLPWARVLKPFQGSLSEHSPHPKVALSS